MIEHLVIGRTDKFNLFPARNGVSDYYSPETLVTGKTFDYNKHCLYEFGKYVQVDTYTEKRNNMKERTLDVIYLRPCEDSNGHLLMCLSTGK